jgi:CubicO group peptidase (beta-lactamase class C family)
VKSYPFLHVEEALRNAVDEGTTAGAALVFGQGERRHEIVVGQAQLVPCTRPLSSTTLFDLASLTKVLATTWLAMKMTAAGRLDVDAPLGDLLPGYYPKDKAALTVRLLMCHAAGLPSGLQLYNSLSPESAGAPARRSVIERYLQTTLTAAPGRRTLYSDIGPILVGDLLEQLASGPHARLDAISAAELYAPLALDDTFFVHLDDPLPSAQRLPEVFAATEDCAWRGRVLVGEVHDENAHLLRGVAGHAGLFSTVRDLERIARAYLAETNIGIDSATLRSLTSAQQLTPDSTRAFGWDKPRADGPSGHGFSPLAYGHTGFTGTSLWIDPQKHGYVILLTNRVHPGREDRGFPALRPRLHNLIHDSLNGPDGWPEQAA